ncbi:MAG: DUF1786 domain-containing protein [Anaerolineales bacterium]|nr:DUF1786 domain-containing protein [Anaerolineales bacterium]
MPQPSILTIDIGTGTQDVYLLRAGLSPENGFKLVMPSATMAIRRLIQQATRRGDAILLEGVTMGGGPCAWAAEDHVRAGGLLYATPAAARTFNDDLDQVQREMGVRLVSEDEAGRLRDVTRIPLRDVDPDALRAAFAAFGVELHPTAVGLAVFDHGAAPAGASDRQFRFDYLAERIRRENRLSAFAYPAAEVPPSLTRLQAVAQSAASFDAPLVVMDTAPAAVLGALLDSRIEPEARRMVVNIGNFHALAFRLGPGGIEGVFEHHTGLLDRPRLEAYLRAFAAGDLTHQAVFDDMGHGALILDPTPLPLDAGGSPVTVTGPRRAMLSGSDLRPIFAAPFGDMMLAGCFGLLQAMADHLAEFATLLRDSLLGQPSDRAPWDVES